MLKNFSSSPAISQSGGVYSWVGKTTKGQSGWILYLGGVLSADEINVTWIQCAVAIFRRVKLGNPAQVWRQKVKTTSAQYQVCNTHVRHQHEGPDVRNTQVSAIWNKRRKQNNFPGDRQHCVWRKQTGNKESMCNKFQTRCHHQLLHISLKSRCFNDTEFSQKSVKCVHKKVLKSENKMCQKCPKRVKESVCSWIQVGGGGVCISDAFISEQTCLCSY